MSAFGLKGTAESGSKERLFKAKCLVLPAVLGELLIAFGVLTTVLSCVVDRFLPKCFLELVRVEDYKQHAEQTNEMEVIEGNIYDFPKYYDLLFGSDWKAEFVFFRQCFEKFARRPVKRLFEPACGTGRLLFRFAKAGYEVCGLDLNPKAVEYCNRRFERHGMQPPAFVGDMSQFRLKKKVDAAFNPINSFRELQTDQQAENHLQCVAEALRKGGLYLLGLHLTPVSVPRCQEESWSARRGNLAVLSQMRSLELDRRNRRELVQIDFDVYTPTRQFRISSKMVFRTYTAEQMWELLRRVPELEVVETFDFSYELEEPIRIGPETEDVVFVLRKR